LGLGLKPFTVKNKLAMKKSQEPWAWMDSLGFDIIAQLLIRFSEFVIFWRKNGSAMRQYVSYS
jgi:hypothetical protein